MRTRNFQRRAIAMALAATTAMSVCAARAQYGAMQPSGAAGSHGARSNAAGFGASGSSSSSSDSPDTNSTDKQGVTSQWNAGAGSFGRGDANAWSAPYKTKSSADMWNPGKGKFSYSVQEGGVWKAQPPVTPSEAATSATEPGNELGAAPVETPQTAIEPSATAFSSFGSGSAPSFGRSVNGQSGNRVGMHSARAIGSQSVAHGREGSMYSMHQGSQFASPFAHHSAHTVRGGAAHQGSSRRSAFGQTKKGAGNSSGGQDQQISPAGLDSLGLDGDPGLRESDHSQRKKIGSGLDDSLSGDQSDQ